MNEQEVKKILVIRLSAIGDTIHTLPSVYAIRNKFPNAQIDWVIEDKSSMFVEKNPIVNNVFIVKRKEKNLKSFIKLIKKIRKERYDIALDFQQLLKSGIILGFSGAKRKITLDKGRELSGIFANEIIKTNRKLFCLNYHVVKRNLDLTRAIGCKTDEIKFILPDFSNENSPEITKIIGNIDKTKKTIVLSPGTTWENKHWIIEGWKDIIKEFVNDYNIIITGTGKEKTLNSKIVEGTKKIIDLSGKTTLCDLVYIYKNADILISPDSGSLQIAWASNIKAIVSLFFATSSLRTAPFGENYVSISADINCSPCMKKNCCLRHSKNECRKHIKSEEVIKVIKELMQKNDN